MIIGMTGGRTEPSIENQQWFDAFLRSLLENDNNIELHHGDCIGADVWAHRCAVDLGIKRVIIHPPTNPKQRAYCLASPFSKTLVEVLDEFAYIERNQHIVNAGELLVALPDKSHTLRSGTWSTVRYALNLQRRVLVPPNWSADLHLAALAVGAS